MKTTIDIINETLPKDEFGFIIWKEQDVQKAMIEYGKQLLIEASERARLQVDDYFEITESEKVSNEDCCVTISKSSILNIINELK